MTPIEWAGIGAGALAFLISFFPWYSFSFDGPSLGFDTSGSLSAWNVGILGWLPVLMLIGAGVVVLLPHLGNDVPNRATIWLGLAAGAVVLILIRWLTLPDDGGLGSLAGSGYSSGAGFGLIVGLLVAIASAVAAFLTFQAAQKARPAGGPAMPPAA
ncbi:hypothetical protein [Actinokineospora sp. HUAS TT18]|uniref:hypothetical protein n=1 Tax=Actinokineospora sp. HUAS TT18 TaxID=3447451 RepID=UPI003F52275D